MLLAGSRRHCCLCPMTRKTMATQRRARVGFRVLPRNSDSPNLRNSKHTLLVLTPPVSHNCFFPTHTQCAWTYPGIRKGGEGRIIISHWLIPKIYYNNHVKHDEIYVERQWCDLLGVGQRRRVQNCTVAACDLIKYYNWMG
jgi:hypothetical protein